MKARLKLLKMRRMSSPGNAGQVMVEYVVLTGLLIGVLLLTAVFLYAFKEFGGRILDLIAYEYP